MHDEFAEDLQAALGTRPVIEQAKGVLIALRGSTADQAFAELRHVSQTHNMKLNALAAALVDAAERVGRAAHQAPHGRRPRRGAGVGLASWAGGVADRVIAARKVPPGRFVLTSPGTLTPLPPPTLPGWAAGASRA